MGGERVVKIVYVTRVSVASSEGFGDPEQKVRTLVIHERRVQAKNICKKINRKIMCD